MPISQKTCTHVEYFENIEELNYNYTSITVMFKNYAK